jgi:hypothetical protein
MKLLLLLELQATITLKFAGGILTVVSNQDGGGGRADKCKQLHNLKHTCSC